jgi:predicted SnoaL-like aldol condensation-catalyzing enzyme
MSPDSNEFGPQVREGAITAAEDRNKAFVLEAFDTLFNQRDYAAAQRYWSPEYIQHSAHIAPGRDGLFNLIKASPPDMRYESGLIVANDDYVVLHGRFSNVGQPADWIVVDVVRLQDGLLAEHWDVIQDEATQEASKSGLPMFGDTFPTRT